MRPDPIGLVTAVIGQRPACVHCIASTVSIDDDGAEAALARIGGVIRLWRNERDRCPACDNIGPVVSLHAPTP